MELEYLVRSTVPDFIDVEVDSYEGESGRTVVKVDAEHAGQTYSFEVVEHDDDTPDEIYNYALRTSYSSLFDQVIDDQIEEMENEDE